MSKGIKKEEVSVIEEIVAEAPKEVKPKGEEIIEIIVSPDPLNKGIQEIPAGINGKIYHIKFNEKVKVPRQVAWNIRDAGYNISSPI